MHQIGRRTRLNAAEGAGIHVRLFDKVPYTYGRCNMTVPHAYKQWQKTSCLGCVVTRWRSGFDSLWTWHMVTPVVAMKYLATRFCNSKYGYFQEELEKKVVLI